MLCAGNFTTLLDGVVWMGWLAVCLTDNCGSALLSGSGGFVADFALMLLLGKRLCIL